jgi:hypothetical protein
MLGVEKTISQTAQNKFGEKAIQGAKSRRIS